MDRSIADRVGTLRPATISGTFYRHAAEGRDAFAGGTMGRWGLAFPVIYLGRPTDSVVVEAHRHLVEEAGIPAGRVRPRVLYTVRVEVQRVLDLTAPPNLAAAGLSVDDLRTVIDDYDICQAVAAAAYQLEYHGILAPAATGLGETLAIFRTRVAADELPVVEAETRWAVLPADPRRLRAMPEPGQRSTP